MSTRTVVSESVVTLPHALRVRVSTTSAYLSVPDAAYLEGADFLPPNDCDADAYGLVIEGYETDWDSFGPDLIVKVTIVPGTENFVTQKMIEAIVGEIDVHVRSFFMSEAADIRAQIA